MKKQDVKLNNQRVSFSKKIKRKILLELAKGKKPKDVLLEYAFNSLSNITNDEKYSSKLLHKWRKELYCNKTLIHFLNNQVDDNVLNYEIENIDTSDTMSANEPVIVGNVKDEFVKMINRT
ncbi:MAG: hypothetical protein E7Z88_00455 [Cyanobacteria bacterium SIG27]|nr:hypothetical protein [Cyanobacteria bacterium SIG27]